MFGDPKAIFQLIIDTLTKTRIMGNITVIFIGLKREASGLKSLRGKFLEKEPPPKKMKERIKFH